MTVVDTSVWIDYRRAQERILVDGSRDGKVAIHEFVIGELALGEMSDRESYMRSLSGVARLPTLPASEILNVILRNKVFGAGIGYVDAHLLASTVMVGNAVLWTRDKRFARIADRLGVLAEFP